MRARRACAGLLLLAICGLARLGQHCAFARTLAAPPEAPFESDAEVLHTADAPIIGVLSQPLGLRAPNTSYFPASYSKYVAMAGARVVPVLCDASTAELHKLYSQINGLVVPGAPGIRLASRSQDFPCAASPMTANLPKGRCRACRRGAGSAAG